MNSVSGIGAGHSAAETAHASMRKVQAERAAQSAGSDQPDEAAPAAGAVFAHTAKESAGRYWVEQRPDGPKVQFDKPTTAAFTGEAAASESALNDKESGAAQAPALQKAQAQEISSDTAAAQSSEPASVNREDAAPSERPDDEPEKPEEDKASQTTVNTDNVDREIEQLRHKVQQLEQKGRTANTDEEQQDADQALANAQRELAMKDNDAYRRAHARVS